MENTENTGFELTPEHIGRCLRVNMAKNDMDNQQLADRFGVSRMTAGNWVAGKISDVKRIYEIAMSFNMTLDEFLEIPKVD